METLNKPFIDLHRHLDGCLTLEIIKKLALMQDVKLPSGNEKELTKMIRVHFDCSSIEEYLACFVLPISLMQTKETLEEATYLVLEDCLKENLIYVELRFAPQLHMQKGLSQEEVVEAVLKGLKRSKMKANLILCMMRSHDNDEINMETIRVLKKYLVSDGGVVALDIAGSELGNQTVNYQKHFAYASKLGIPFTIHAGETDGYESEIAALKFGAKRLGHGLRSYESKELMDYLKEHQIILEMCPISNSLSKACLDMNKYPFKKYLDYGIKVTLNTDSPSIHGKLIQAEYQYIDDHFGLTNEEYYIIMNNAIDGAFTTEKVKNNLRKLLLEYK